MRPLSPAVGESVGESDGVRVASVGVKDGTAVGISVGGETGTEVGGTEVGATVEGMLVEGAGDGETLGETTGAIDG
jgi:hypothetical protein